MTARQQWKQHRRHPCAKWPHDTSNAPALPSCCTAGKPAYNSFMNIINSSQQADGPPYLGLLAQYNGIVHRKHFGSVLTHFFNHQTHHRGQASTLLTQAGADIGVTDLVAWVPAIASKT